MKTQQLDQEIEKVNQNGYAPMFYLERNPNFGEILQPDRAVRHVSKAFSLPISAGKNTYVYDAHTYHTKVPPDGIKLLIDYYTNPGDVVLDLFCGSGMTGVAALESERAALLCDLSPAATFIAYNFNTPISASKYLDAVKKLLANSRSIEEKLYTTQCRLCKKDTAILYTVWSYGLLCNPLCQYV